MNIVSAKQTGVAAELNPMTEFREGVELLKNEYPQKALAKLRRAYECDKHNPYFMSFLGLSIARAQHGSTAKAKRDPVLPESWRSVRRFRDARESLR